MNNIKNLEEMKKLIKTNNSQISYNEKFIETLAILEFEKIIENRKQNINKNNNYSA